MLIMMKILAVQMDLMIPGFGSEKAAQTLGGVLKLLCANWLIYLLKKGIISGVDES